MADLFALELVVYDETENFRNYDDPSFDYPYEQRKTKIGQHEISEVANFDPMSDYKFPRGEVEFRLS